MALLVRGGGGRGDARRSRAYAVSVLTMTATLGAGVAVMLLWVGGVAPWGWQFSRRARGRDLAGDPHRTCTAGDP